MPTIRYFLQSNPGTPDPKSFYARVSTFTNYTEEDLAQDLVHRNVFPNTAVGLGTIRSIQALIAEKVADGCAVNTALATYRPGITGVFHGPDDHFDPARHNLKPCLQTGPLLRQAVRAASVQKTKPTWPAPVLTAFLDHDSGSQNATLTPRGIGEAIGQHLKYGTQPGEGLWLVHSATGEDTPVAKVAKKTKGRLLFLCPDLTPGTYNLEVRQAGPDGVLRFGRLNALLTVN